MAGRLHIRDRSCLLRCSLLLKARLQNWHLYFLSGTREAFRDVGVDVADAGIAATLVGMVVVVDVAPGPSRLDSTVMAMVVDYRRRRQGQRHSEVVDPLRRTIVEIA